MRWAELAPRAWRLGRDRRRGARRRRDAGCGRHSTRCSRTRCSTRTTTPRSNCRRTADRRRRRDHRRRRRSRHRSVGPGADLRALRALGRVALAPRGRRRPRARRSSRRSRAPTAARAGSGPILGGRDVRASASRCAGGSRRHRGGAAAEAPVARHRRGARSASIGGWPPSTASTARRPSPRWSGRKRSCGRSRTRSSRARCARRTCSPARAAPARRRSRASSRSRVNCAARPDRDARQHLPRVRRDHERHVARRDRDGRRVAARHRRHPRDPRPRRPAAGRGEVQGLHPRRGAPAHRRRLERAAEADRGAAAAPALRLLHDRAAEGAADRALALPDVRLPAAAAAGARAQAAPDRGRRGDRRARRRARARSRAAGAAPTATPSRRSTSSRRRPAARSPCRTSCSCSARSRTRCSSGSATWSSTDDTAGALLFLEELSTQGQDLGRLVTDLLEHLRHLLLVQHMNEVPDSLPVTDEARERLREQANQLPPATVVRLIDLLAVAVDDMRQGGDPRLPLELALVKVTRPCADLSREALAHRLELLEQGRPARLTNLVREANQAPACASRAASRAARPPTCRSSSSSSRRRGGGRSCRRSSSGRSRSARRSRRRDPPALAGDTLTLEFPQTASFHLQARRGSEERGDAARRALRGDRAQARGRCSSSASTRTRATHDDDRPASEEDVLELMKSTFDARELDE